jgi:hypothetical protein
MAREIPFFQAAWKGLRTKALAATIDIGHYVILWASIFLAHLMKILASRVGVDQDVISFVSSVEKYAWCASFSVFFWRVGLGLWQEFRSAGK